MRKYLLIFLGISLLFSCNIHIEKRLYRKGYYVEVNANNHIKSGKQRNAVSNENLKNQTELVTNHSLTNNKISIPIGDEIVRKDIAVDDNMVASVGSTEPITTVDKNKITYANDDLKPLATSKNKPTIILKTDVESNKNTNADSDLYILAALMGLVVFGLFRFSQRISLNVSRWASKNKIITKLLIAMMQINIGYFGVMTGKGLFALGHTFSNRLEYIFGGIIALAILNLLLSKPKDNVMVLRSYYLRKLNFLAIMLSYFMITVGIGNKLGDHRTQISPLGYVVEKSYDAICHPASSTLGTTDSKQSSSDEVSKTTHPYKTTQTKGDGTGWPAWYIVIYILMTLLLICAIAMMFLFTPIGAAIPVSVICVAFIVAVPILMARRVRLGNIKRKEKKEKIDKVNNTLDKLNKKE